MTSTRRTIAATLVAALLAIASAMTVTAQELPSAACNQGTSLAHTLVTNEVAHGSIPLTCG